MAHGGCTSSGSYCHAGRRVAGGRGRGRVGPIILLDFVEGIVRLLALKSRPAFLCVNAASIAGDGGKL